MESFPSLIQFAPYELLPKKSLNAKSSGQARQGCWLKLHDNYADYFSWPEFGDFTWDQDVDLPLSERSPLFQRCIQILKDKSLFQDAPASQPAWWENHFLIHSGLESYSALEEAYQKGFRTFKVKMTGRKNSLFSEQQKVFFQEHPQTVVRLDANQSLLVEDLSSILQQIDFLKTRLEFLEDPFLKQDPLVWAGWNTKIPLAADFEKQKWMTQQHVRFFIVKPQREDPAEWIGKSDSILSVITHSMESPVGRALTLQQMPWLMKKWGQSIHPVCGLADFGTYQNFDTTLFVQEGSRIQRSSVKLQDFFKETVWQNLS